MGTIPSDYFKYEEQREAIEDAFNLAAGEARAEFKRSMATIKARRDNALLRLAATYAPIHRGQDFRSAGRELDFEQ